MRQILKVGEKAPDFDLPTQDGKNVKLGDFTGKWLVVYFYPRDDTPGCTVEAVEFTELKKDFGKNGASLLGVSPDNEKKHCKFINIGKMMSGIYIHFPFCKVKCGYCDFFSITDKEHFIPLFINSLSKEIELFFEMETRLP